MDPVCGASHLIFGNQAEPVHLDARPNTEVEIT